MTIVTKQNSQVTVTIDGVSWGTFDTRTGGEVTSTISKRRPGGMRAEITFAGLPSASDVVVTRPYDLQADHARAQALRAAGRVGRARMTVADQPLDENGVKFGAPDIYNGRLSGLTLPEKDSTSTDVAMIQFTMAVETA